MDFCNIKLTEDIFQPATYSKNMSTVVLSDGQGQVEIGRKLGSGSYGDVFVGTLAAKAGRHDIVLKKSRRDASLLDEAAMQVKVFCEVQRHGFSTSIQGVVDMHDAARIPRPLVAVSVQGSHLLGMERAETTVVSHVKPDKIDAFDVCVRQLANTILFLQHRLDFMHGDLHSMNVMMRTGTDRRPYVYVIDFGMSSIQDPQNRSKRIVTDRRFDDMPFNASLDLLTFLTCMREDLVYDAPRIVALIDIIIGPFWSEVQRGMDDPKAKLKYGARDTCTYATKFQNYLLQRGGSNYYSHHVLYESNRSIKYPATTPTGLVSLLSTRPSDSTLMSHYTQNRRKGDFTWSLSLFKRNPSRPPLVPKK